MSTLMKRSSLQAAERRIMADLMNSFLAGEITSTGRITHSLISPKHLHRSVDCTRDS